MKKLKLEIEIEATRAEVWDSIVDPTKYMHWTSAFHEGSYFEGGWNKGDEILFLALDENGERGGMIAQIEESRYPEFISIKHLGVVERGMYDTTSAEVMKWAPAYENYTIEKIDENRSRFRVEMDAMDEFYDMFIDLWPKAMEKLKQVSEGRP
jgi:hypothetical protein